MPRESSFGMFLTFLLILMYVISYSLFRMEDKCKGLFILIIFLFLFVEPLSAY